MDLKNSMMSAARPGTALPPNQNASIGAAQPGSAMPPQAPSGNGDLVQALLEAFLGGQGKRGIMGNMPPQGGPLSAPKPQAPQAPPQAPVYAGGRFGGQGGSIGALPTPPGPPKGFGAPTPMGAPMTKPAALMAGGAPPVGTGLPMPKMGMNNPETPVGPNAPIDSQLMGAQAPIEAPPTDGQQVPLDAQPQGNNDLEQALLLQKLGQNPQASQQMLHPQGHMLGRLFRSVMPGV